MSVFSQFKSTNNLESYQVDELVNEAFTKLSNSYCQFSLTYDEDGVSVINFDDCNEEETGGWSREQVEANLTEELTKLANELV